MLTNKHKVTKQIIPTKKVIKDAILSGRNLKLWGVKDCRNRFDCGNTEEHLSHVIYSDCCDALCCTHFSQGELILLCTRCTKPQFRIQVAYNIPLTLTEDIKIVKEKKL